MDKIKEMRETLNEGRVLVDFFATWCGPCKVLKPTVEKFAAEQSDVNVVLINVDEHSDIASEFGVRSIPTLLYLENGEVIGREVGNKQLDQLYTFTKIK
jgi:thioredoxin 1